jgi:hypothetical protein
MKNKPACPVLTLFISSAIPASGTFASDLAGSSGTLIVGIPISDGLIIAADTRHTTNGLACDFGTKLYVPTNLPSTVFGLTGLSSFYATRPSANCLEIESSPVIFNIERTVRSFLLRSSSIRQLDIVALANECTAAFGQFLANSGPMIDRSSLVARTSVFTIVLAAYEQDTRTSILREISIRLPSPTQIAVEQTVVASYDPTGQPDWRAFGQGGYLVEHVINGPGKQFLSDNYKKFEGIARIDELSSELAIQVAENLIEATSKTSEIVLIPAGIGGHIDVYFLSKDGTTKIK